MNVYYNNIVIRKQNGISKLLDQIKERGWNVINDHGMLRVRYKVWTLYRIVNTCIAHLLKSRQNLYWHVSKHGASLPKLPQEKTGKKI